MDGSVRGNQRSVLEELKGFQSTKQLNRTNSLKHLEGPKPKCIFGSSTDIHVVPRTVVPTRSYDSSSVSSLSSDSGLQVATPPPSLSNHLHENAYHLNNTSASAEIDTPRRDLTGGSQRTDMFTHNDDNNNIQVLQVNSKSDTSNYVSVLTPKNVTRSTSFSRKQPATSPGKLTPYGRRQSGSEQIQSNSNISPNNGTRERKNSTNNNTSHVETAREVAGEDKECERKELLSRRESLTSPGFVSRYRSENNLIISGQLRRSSVQKDIITPSNTTVNNSVPPTRNTVRRSMSVNETSKTTPVRHTQKRNSLSSTGKVPLRLSSLNSSFTYPKSSQIASPPPLPPPPSSPHLSSLPKRYVSTYSLPLSNKRSSSEPRLISSTQENQKSRAYSTNIQINNPGSNEHLNSWTRTYHLNGNPNTTSKSSITQEVIIEDKVTDENVVSTIYEPSSSSASSESSSDSEAHYTSDSTLFDSYDVTEPYFGASESDKYKELPDKPNSTCVLYTIKKVGDTVKTVRQKIRPGTVSDMRKLFSQKEIRKRKRKVKRPFRKPDDANRGSCIPSENADTSHPKLLTPEIGSSVTVNSTTVPRYQFDEKIQETESNSENFITKTDIVLSEWRNKVNDKQDDNVIEAPTGEFQNTVPNRTYNVNNDDEITDHENDDDVVESGTSSSSNSDSESSDANENDGWKSDNDKDSVAIEAEKHDIIYQTKPEPADNGDKLPSYIDNLIPSKRTFSYESLTKPEMKTSSFKTSFIKSRNRGVQRSFSSADRKYYNSCENLRSSDFTIPPFDYVTKTPNPFYRNSHIVEAAVHRPFSDLEDPIKYKTWTHSPRKRMHAQGGSAQSLCDEVSESRNESEPRNTEINELNGYKYVKLDITDSFSSLGGGTYVPKIKVSPSVHTAKHVREECVINKSPERSVFGFDTPVADDKSSVNTRGDDVNVDHVTEILTSDAKPVQVRSPISLLTTSELTCTTEAPLKNTQVKKHRISLDSEFEVNGKRYRVLTMPERSSGNSSFRESFNTKDGRHITTKYLSNTNGNMDLDLNANETGDENEKTIALLKQAMLKLNGENNDDVIPEIKQSVTKLDGGGNLVITTLTRKIVEEEDDVLSSPDRSRGNVYYVEDHLGNVYEVEDITDETPESAYYSSSERHISDSSAHNTSHEGDYNKIFNLHAVDNGGISNSTAEEVLLGIYNPESTGSSLQIEELDEYNRSYESNKQLAKYVPPKQGVEPYGYMADSSLKKSSSCTYEMPGNPKPYPKSMPQSTSTVKTVKQSYEMTSGNPWGNDGDSITSASGGEDEIKMQREETVNTTRIDNTGCNAMMSTYKYQTDASLMPQPIVPYVPLPQPLLQIAPPPPQSKLVTLDMTPVQMSTQTPIMTTRITESPKPEPEPVALSDPGRPVYKSVALVKGPYETPKWQEMERKIEEKDKKYKILSTHASDNIQEKTTSYEDVNTTYRICKCETSNGNFSNFKENMIDQSRNWSVKEHPNNMYRSEKVIHVNGFGPTEPKKHVSVVGINDFRDVVDSKRHQNHDDMMTTMEFTENNKSMTTQKMTTETTMPPIKDIPPPHMADLPSVQRDMRIVRGNILIKNTMEEGLDEFNDNINLFHNGFNLSKQNPLYQSDEDLHKSVQTETHDDRRRHQDQDLTYETVDRYTKTKKVPRDKPKPQYKNLSQLLLSKLSTIDAKDIRQHIDVKHNNEDIYGDIRFQQADGKTTGSGNTSDFDSVSENIALVMKDGKAIITITAVAERYTPVDYDFSVWRKSQAIVTRVIEIDFLANEQRRRLYYHVMGRSSDDGHRKGGRQEETVLSSKETMDLFSEIMDAAEGEGDIEDITVKTKQHRTTMPPPRADFLY